MALPFASLARDDADMIAATAIRGSAARRDTGLRCSGVRVTYHWLPRLAGGIHAGHPKNVDVR